MKRIFRSPEIANLIALGALVFSIISVFYAYHAYKFNTDVVMAERKTELIEQIESYLSTIDKLYIEYDRFLKESNFRLDNELLILLGENRETLRKTQGDLRELLSKLDVAQLPVDPYYLGDAQRQVSRLNQELFKLSKDFEVIKARAANLRDTSK